MSPDSEHGKYSLSDFHKTISEQLNSRLSESPRFFWVVALSITGYGYILWTYDEKPALFPIATLVVYLSILWATWYLAALGYAFRYLQNAQHRIEDDLGWEIYRPKTTGIPPEKIRKLSHVFWLLPGIYHAHLGGFVGLSLVLSSVYVSRTYNECGSILLALSFILFEIVWIVGWNYHYLSKFRETFVRPRGDTVVSPHSPAP